jgi:hypothetical protein
MAFSFASAGVDRRHPSYVDGSQSFVVFVETMLPRGGSTEPRAARARPRGPIGPLKRDRLLPSMAERGAAGMGKIP